MDGIKDCLWRVHSIPYFTHDTSYCICAGAFGRLWMLYTLQCCFASCYGTLLIHFESYTLQVLNWVAKGWNGDQVRVKNVKWLYTVMRHSIYQCLERKIRLMYVWAPVFSTTPVAASLPLDIVGSSSAPLVLLETPLPMLLSCRPRGLSIVGFSFTPI